MIGILTAMWEELCIDIFKALLMYNTFRAFLWHRPNKKIKLLSMEYIFTEVLLVYVCVFVCVCLCVSVRTMFKML